MIGVLILAAGAALSSGPPWNARYEVTCARDHHLCVVLDIQGILLQLKQDGLFSSISSHLCSQPPCTVSFWLDATLAPKKPSQIEEKRPAMFARYLQSETGAQRLYHSHYARADLALREAECIKEVFHSYCLGGEASSLPPPLESKQKSESIEERLYPDITTVTLLRGRVASVWRLYPGMTWLRFASLRADIGEIYGQGLDLSGYPSWADDTESKTTAIRLQEGKACYQWDQGEWTIRLAWVGDSAGLFYEHEALHRALELEDPGEGY